MTLKNEHTSPHNTYTTIINSELTISSVVIVLLKQTVVRDDHKLAFDQILLLISITIM